MFVLFTDPAFLFLLLPLTAAGFYALTPRFGPAAGLALLLAASLLFYAAWGGFPFLLLLCSIAANFAAAYFLLTIPDRKPHRSAFLWAGLAYNFGTLAYFKYRVFAPGAVPGFATLSPAIPVGISFYTFQQAMVLVDAYYRDESVTAFFGAMRTFREKALGFLRHAFFVSFFAHVLIGPIVYLKEFQPQIARTGFGRLRRRDLEVGLTLIVLGLFKKFILADRLGLIADPLFAKLDADAHPAMAAAWLGAAAFHAQIYFDFSAYADMALGCARLFGIRFPINFYSPLKAVGIMDFYRRWHMTLTRAISRFFYMPLSLAGTRLAQRRKLSPAWALLAGQWIPLLLNFEAIALWHGVQTTFVLFGIVHGTWYVAETAIRRTPAWKRWRQASSEATRALLGRMLFLPLMMLSFALFRSSDLESFRHLLESMFANPRFGRPPLTDILTVLAAFGVIYLLPNSMEFLRRYRPGIATYANKSYGWSALLFAWRPNWAWALTMGALALAVLYFAGVPAPFVYLGY